VIESVDERIEPRLLPQRVRRGGLGRILLERQMHPLVLAILLGMPWPVPVDLNAEPQPPDGELTQVVQRHGR
jgi:hypothetical protein